jgi:hypothetical protein
VDVGEGVVDFAQGVGLGGRRGNVGSGEGLYIVRSRSFGIHKKELYLVAVQGLEQINGLLDIVNNFLLRFVVSVAAGLERVHAGSWVRN